MLSTRVLLGATFAAAALWPPSAAPGATRTTERYLAPRGACPGQANPSASLNEQATSLGCLVNWARRRHGLRGVGELPLLDRSALLRALAIRRCDDFSHTPCGQPFSAIFYAVGYLTLGGNAEVGENLAWGQGALGTARRTMRSWLFSPPHRANLFRAGWNDFGVSIVKADRLSGVANARIWVSQFGRRG